MTKIADMAAALTELTLATAGASLDTDHLYPAEKILLDFHKLFPDITNAELQEVVRLAWPMTEARMDERRDIIADFIERGLVVVDEWLPDGSATFIWGQPDHPEVVAFRAVYTRH